MYGAQETNIGDTLYDDFDPATPFAMTIWDSDGVDTINLSNFTEGCDLSLVSGTSSTVVCEVGGAGWQSGQMLDNLSIAFNTEIENLIAGSGDDTIVGNSANNTITGGEGADTFVFQGDFGDDVITDFTVGTDQLTFKDTDGTALAWNDASISADNVSTDLVITVSSNTLTLVGLDGVSFNDSFIA